MILRILYYYYKNRFLAQHFKSREQLEHYQQKRFKKLVKRTLSKSIFYKEYLHKPLNEWPIINKSIMMQEFNDIVTVNIKKEQALEVALQAERSRDFTPLIHNIAVGLSSGTSGNRGIFLTSPRERDMWAGIILAKILPMGFKAKEKIAFFLRANNNLYTNLNKSRKVQIYFFDLLADFDKQVQRLNDLQPTILAAPASVLLMLARRKEHLMISPNKIFSVAEVLDPSDERVISSAFDCKISQVYQCTEGFLAISSKQCNTLTMNEEFLIIEKEWLDKERFVPIITDLMRSSQPVVRYRLDDVLISKNNATVFTQLKAIEGRLGDVCYGKGPSGPTPIFADTLRQQMVSSATPFEDYRICQDSLSQFSIQVVPELIDKNGLIEHLNLIFKQKNCELPEWRWEPFARETLGVKKRKIRSRVVLCSDSKTYPENHYLSTATNG